MVQDYLIDLTLGNIPFDQIDSIERNEGDSNIAAALRVVRNDIVTSTTNRPWAEDIVIVMTGEDW